MIGFVPNCIVTVYHDSMVKNRCTLFAIYGEVNFFNCYLANPYKLMHKLENSV